MSPFPFSRKSITKFEISNLTESPIHLVHEPSNLKHSVEALSTSSAEINSKLSKKIMLHDHKGAQFEVTLRKTEAWGLAVVKSAFGGALAPWRIFHTSVARSLLSRVIL